MLRENDICMLFTNCTLQFLERNIRISPPKFTSLRFKLQGCESNISMNTEAEFKEIECGLNPPKPGLN